MATGQPPGTDPTKPWSVPPTMQQGQQRSEDNPQFQRRPLNRSELTEEEKRVMKECESDSFYQRALPLAMGAMLGTSFMVKSGRWAAHPRFGAIPKNIIAGGLAYFVGKVSYLPVCQEKILREIPNTDLAAAIRKARRIPEKDATTDTWEEMPKSDSSRDKTYSNDYKPQEGIDDRYRPSVDKEVKVQDPAQEEKTPTTYEDLRRRNRQEYEDNLSKRQKPPGAPSYKDSPLIPQKPWPDPPNKSPKTEFGLGDPSREYEAPPPPQEPQKRRRTNIWGDPIDE